MFAPRPTALCFLISAFVLCSAPSFADGIRGLLRIHPENPRWLTDDGERALFLTGSHTWATVQERQLPETPAFDFEDWLDFMSEHDHNFLRIWVWEHASWMQFTDRKVRYSPTLYERTGPGEALDGEPKFDLTRFNEMYFTRLRERVLKANARGINVAVMLFQGFSLDKTGGNPELRKAYHGHPYHRANNINGIDGDPNGSGTGLQVHTLENPAVLKVQEAYVRKMIDTLNDVDGLVWEIGNELHDRAVEFQYHWIDFIKAYERTKPKQHLVGMSGAHVTNEKLFASKADWIAPEKQDGYQDDIPDVAGRKVVIIDTDHIEWLKSRDDPTLPWRALMRGANFIYMDTYKDARFGSPETLNPDEAEIRRQMGFAARFSRTIDLAHMRPDRELASSEHCLANPGREYAAFAPAGDTLRLDLGRAGGGEFTVTWFDCRSGKFHRADAVTAKGSVELTNPFDWHAAVHLVREDSEQPFAARRTATTTTAE